ncbi:hypothetical protein [Streptomyces sp. NPDC089799]|uniref:hypothetical protein n=1 Tax=Streptomyces sp. NPDC089799 TaxID=3155066 RepID=UPI0034295E60
MDLAAEAGAGEVVAGEDRAYGAAQFYYFDAAPGPIQQAPLALPQTLTVPPPAGRRLRQTGPSGWTRLTAHAVWELTIYQS